MKLTLTALFALTLFVSIVVPRVAVAQETLEFQDVDDLDLTTENLKDIMGQMGRNFKILVDALVKNQPLPDSQLASSAQALVHLAGRASLTLPSKLLGPNGQPKPGTEALVTQYRSIISRLTVALGELRDIVSTGNRAAAKNVLVGKVAPIQREGHEIFK